MFFHGFWKVFLGFDDLLAANSGTIRRVVVGPTWSTKLLRSQEEAFKHLL